VNPDGQICYFKMVALRALVFRPLVKGNEAMGKRLSSLFLVLTKRIVASGDKNNISVDQAFFPLTGAAESWNKVKRRTSHDAN